MAVPAKRPPSGRALATLGIHGIVREWCGLVPPALVLNYLGQGAYLLHDPEAARNPFYALVRSPARQCSWVTVRE